jgi:rhodanese-related sulfurtransferase
MHPTHLEATMHMTAYSASRSAFQALGPSQGWWTTLPPWAIPAGLSLLLFLIVIVLKLRNLPSHLRAKNKSTLDPTQLEDLMIGTPPQIIDLRPKMDYEGKKGHIRGALNIPFNEFKGRMDELDTSHPRPIVLVDESDALSHEVMPLLEKQGHRWIYVLKGGYRAWRQAKFPVYQVPEKPKK